MRVDWPDEGFRIHTSLTSTGPTKASSLPPSPSTTPSTSASEQSSCEVPDQSAIRTEVENGISRLADTAHVLYDQESAKAVNFDPTDSRGEPLVGHFSRLVQSHIDQHLAKSDSYLVEPYLTERLHTTAIGRWRLLSYHAATTRDERVAAPPVTISRSNHEVQDPQVEGEVNPLVMTNTQASDYITSFLSPRLRPEAVDFACQYCGTIRRAEELQDPDGWR